MSYNPQHNTAQAPDNSWGIYDFLNDFDYFISQCSTELQNGMTQLGAALNTSLENVNDQIQSYLDQLQDTLNTDQDTLNHDTDSDDISKDSAKVGTDEANLSAYQKESDAIKNDMQIGIQSVTQEVSDISQNNSQLAQIGLTMLSFMDSLTKLLQSS